MFLLNGIGNGRRMIVAETCSWIGLYVGEVYDQPINKFQPRSSVVHLQRQVQQGQQGLNGAGAAPRNFAGGGRLIHRP
jgi:hypothetical protein